MSYRKNKWYNPSSLKGKILLTIFLLLIIQIGCQIPVPFINHDYLTSTFQNNTDLFSILNTFTGGAFKNLAFFALGVTPYITASIILQLLSIAFPKLGEIQKDGASGKDKWERITLITGIGLAFFQSIFLAISFGRQGLFNKYTWYVVILTSIIWTIGTAIVSLIGQFITKHGIGNGTSIIIAANIIAGLPSTAMAIYEMYLRNKEVVIIILNSFITLAITFGIIAFVVILENAHKDIPIQYAKSSNYGHKINSTIPIKLNAANVMPIIFASTIYSLPIMFFGNSTNKVLLSISKFFSSSAWFDLNHWYYTIGFFVYGLMVIGFAYFYTSIVFNPVEIANNLKKTGAVIPGIRPGKTTQDYIASQIKYITLMGALFLFVIAEIPTLLSKIFNLGSLSFGGTSIIIVVGVITELTKIIFAEKAIKGYKTSKKSVLFGVPTKL